MFNGTRIYSRLAKTQNCVISENLIYNPYKYIKHNKELMYIYATYADQSIEMVRGKPMAGWWNLYGLRMFYYIFNILTMLI